MKKLLYTIAFATWAISATGQTDSLKCNPNPFVANANISFYAAAMDTFTISIYNRWGAVVYQPFVDSVINSGSFPFVWYAGSYPDGIYAVALTSKSGVFVHIRISKYMYAGIAQFKNPTDLKIYPNPTHGTINIETSHTFDVLKIYSIDNKLLKEIINPPTNISVADLPAGAYLLIGEKQGKLIFSYKIICP